MLLLGAYGQFGSRIAAELAREAVFHVLLAGRHLASAQAQADALRAGGAAAHLEPLHFDVEAPGLERAVAACAPQLVIHTAGPFQARDYAVARAALHAGAHYVDLADGRDFVMGFASLDALARQCQRRAVCGASSVPGLSAAVVDGLAARFARLDAVESAIAPGNRTTRGLATTRAILSYVGRPFRACIDGQWRTVRGWQSLRQLRDTRGRTRWLARCEVPDLALLPALHPTLRTCDFRAGLELRRMHFGLWLASWAVRAGLVRELDAWAAPLLALSNRWLRAGSDTGLMQVSLSGVDHEGRPLALDWRIEACEGSGPQIPATAAVLLARKLAHGALTGAGAGPCVGLFTVDEFMAALARFPIRATLQERRG